ncbi:hypothetical protein OROMI_034415 [Orobanche minor]
MARILVFKIRPSQEILKIHDGTPFEAEGILTYQKRPSKLLGLAFSSKLDVPSNVVQKKRVARILVFKIRPSQEILKIRDGTHLEAEGILTYQKRPPKLLGPRNCSVWHFSSKLDVSSNVVQNKRVARILVFEIRPSQEILKIRDGTPLEAEGILTYQKRPPKLLGLAFSSKLDVPSNVVQKKRVARILVFKIKPSQEILKIRDGTPLEVEGILTYQKRVARIMVFKIRPSQEILKIRDGTPLEAEGILTYQKRPPKLLGLAFSSKLNVPSNVVQKKRVARILVFKIRPSQEILKIRDGTPLEAEGILTYQKRPSEEILKIRDGTPLEAEGILTYQKRPPKLLGLAFSSKLDVPSNVVQKKRMARILVFKIRPSQEILKIRDGTPLEAEGILTYQKRPPKLLDVPSNVVQKKRVARILVFKIRPSEEILKIRDGTPLEAEEILTYQKRPPKLLGLAFSSKLDVPSNVVQKKRVAQILVFKIRPSQEILKIRDGTPLEAEEILTYRKRVARILVFKIRPSQEILKIRDGTPLEAEEILTYQKRPPKLLGLAFSSKLDVPSNVVQKKRVARILVFKIRPSQEILKIRDGTPLEAEEILTYQKRPPKLLGLAFSSKLDVPSNVVQKKRMARILVFKIWPSQEILKIRDGTPLEAEGILTYQKRPPKLLVQKKRVARILVFKIRPSEEILKIRDGTPLEAEEILTYQKRPPKLLGLAFSSKLNVPSNVVQKKRVARILVFKIRPSQEILKIRDGNPLEAEGILTYQKRPSQEILKIRDGTPLEAEGILTYQKGPQNCSVWHFSSKLDVPSNVVQKKRVARILVFKIRPSEEILKIRDGTPLEAEGILTYQKRPPKLLGLAFSSKLDVPSNVVQKKRVARILVFKIRPSQEILKIRDGTHLEAEGILTYQKSKLDVSSNVVQNKRVARILVFKIRPSQEILKIRDGTPLEAEGILTYQKRPPKLLGLAFSSKLDVPSNVVQKKRVARILVFKIKPSQEILKIRDGTPLEKKRVARILVFKIRPSQEILKIRDGTPLELEGILTYQKRPPKLLGLAFSSKLNVPSNVVQKKRVARILVFKIRPSQEILKIRDGTPLEAEGILTYQKRPPKLLGLAFSSKLDVPSNVVQKKRVAQILVFKIRPSQEILKIRDGTPLEAEEILTYRKRPSKLLVARILVFKIRPSEEILKIRDGTPLEAEEILTYQKRPPKLLGLAFSSKLDVPSNVVQKKRVARILVFKIRPSQEILKIRDGTPLEAEEILTYQKRPPKLLGLAFSSKLDVPSNVVQKKRMARILVFKIWPSQEILKIRDGTPLEAEGILTYQKRPPKLLDVSSNVVQNKRVARILVFKIRPSQEILKIRDGTPLEAEGILTYQKRPPKLLGLAFSSKLDVPSNVVQKKRVARILVFKIKPSQEILKIRDGTPLEVEGILTYQKRPPKLLVARILVFKIRPSQEILKIRDGTPLELEGILTYQKRPPKLLGLAFSSKLNVPSNVVQKKRVARILVFNIRPSQEILKIRDGTPLEAEGILTYQKRPSQEILKIRDGTPLELEGILTYQKRPPKLLGLAFSSKLNVPSNVVQKKRVARILVFNIRPSQEILKIRDVARILVFKIRPSEEILKIRDGTPLEAEGILTYQKRPPKLLGLAFSSKLDVPSNVVQKKRMARILVFKIRPSQEILKIRDGTPLEAEGILTYQKRPPKLLGLALF